MLANTIQPRELTRMLLVALHEEDIDETLEAMYPENGEEEEQVTWEEETAQAIAGEFKEGLEKILTRESYPSPHAGLPGVWGGSAPRGSSTSASKIEKELSKAIVRVRGYTEETGNEAAIVLDEEGNMLGTMAEGDEHGVNPAEQVRLGDPHTHIHSHPRDCSFSPADIQVLLYNGNDRDPIEHLIVTTPSGRMYRLSRTDDTWGWREGDHEIALKVAETWATVGQAHYDFQRGRGLSKDAANVIATDVAVRAAATQAHLDYEVIEP